MSLIRLPKTRLRPPPDQRLHAGIDLPQEPVELGNTVPVAGRDPKPDSSAAIECIELGDEAFQTLLPRSRPAKTAAHSPAAAAASLHGHARRRPKPASRASGSGGTPSPARPRPARRSECRTWQPHLFVVQGGGGIDDAFARGVQALGPFPQLIFSSAMQFSY